jgi:cytochrome c biogenesis protein CcmG, thiol:disulfide interchange protein DsbE
MGVLTRRRVLGLVATLVAGGALVTLVATAPRPRVTSIEASGPMPAIDEPSMNGHGRITRERLRGTVVVVNFWASWCGPCRREQPALTHLWREYRDRGVEFLGVNFREQEAAALAYLEEFDVPYASIADPTGLVAHRFGVPYLPATILVDASGEMRLRLVGEQTEASIRTHLDDLLTGAA